MLIFVCRKILCRGRHSSTVSKCKRDGCGRFYSHLEVEYFSFFRFRRRRRVPPLNMQCSNKGKVKKI